MTTTQHPPSSRRKYWFHHTELLIETENDSGPSALDSGLMAEIFRHVQDSPAMQDVNLTIVDLRDPAQIPTKADSPIAHKIRHQTSDAVILFGNSDQVPKNHSVATLKITSPNLDASRLAKSVIEELQGQLKNRKMYGLVLVGGHSTRMGQDKATLTYLPPDVSPEKLENTAAQPTATQTTAAQTTATQPIAEAKFNLVNKFCQKTFLSSRPGQTFSNDCLGHLPRIEDRFLEFGPMGGILSAMVTHPDAAWLVVACDLPFVNHKTLAYLNEHRHPFKNSTAYMSSQSHGFPEPLCTIYEPSIYPKLMQYLGFGYQCPRKVLMNTSVKLLEQQNQQWLTNVNYHSEYVQINGQVEST